MKKLVIVGHGTGGTIIATKMREKLSGREWETFRSRCSQNS